VDEKPVVYTFEEWAKLGETLFGPDRKKWMFECPNCGHVQSTEDFEKVNVENPENVVFYSCIGRFIPSEGTIGNGKSPCNYTNGGLFNLAPWRVMFVGEAIPVFAFSAKEHESATS